ncbi:hypothetical protein M9H77_16769 [Catharanthus roseus]|uniref:Uncharacterized protein n=1 Tax=Catharanthus roseus TaxID=4058 RepID=A0ACC0B2N7_CATRO|nr:hypothetical protein M9H77_16769 [Catharanthus roseus]
MFSTAYHMLCRMHIDQNVLAKLTELTKDEEVASRFVKRSWKKLFNEIDEQEYLRKLDALKTKWKSRPDFLHYLFNTWLNPFAHKFVRCWTKSVMYFGVEATNRAESQIAEIKASLEFSRTKEMFNAKSNQIARMALYEDIIRPPLFLQVDYIISTGPVSNVREMCHLAKGVLSPILPEDPNVILALPPEVVVTKGRKKTNSTKRDKSHWEHVFIAYRKIQKLSGSCFGSGCRSGSG